MRVFKYPLLLLIVFSCNHRNSDTFFKAFKKDSTQSNDKTIGALPIITSKLGLPPITNGVDSFEMRFWLPYTLDPPKNALVLRIRYSQNKWLFNQTVFWSRIPEHLASDTINYFRQTTIDSVKQISFSSPIDVQSVVKELQLLDLQNSPSQNEINEGQMIDNFHPVYAFEFANTSSYRVFTYTCADRHPKLNEFDHKVRRFIKFLQTELDIKLVDCRK